MARALAAAAAAVVGARGNLCGRSPLVAFHPLDLGCRKLAGWYRSNLTHTTQWGGFSCKICKIAKMQGGGGERRVGTAARQTDRSMIVYSPRRT